MMSTGCFFFVLVVALCLVLVLVFCLLGGIWRCNGVLYAIALGELGGGFV